MRTDSAPIPTRLADYTPTNFQINSVYLDFDLNPNTTRVRSRLQLTRLSGGDLVLDGEDISLKSVRIDGKHLKRSEYKLTQTQLILNNLPDSCVLEIETVCNPSTNSTLMGLYVSGGRFCTQCEAQGFRRMTYYMDRPDVMSVFKVRIEAPREKYPYLLANGNCIEQGELPGGKHFAIWEDPFKKPCYLFALVAGEFDLLEDSFKTMSGRDIPLTIYVDPGDAPRAEYAMDSLKRSMKWDEEAFGREYDLDRFMIVAVRDFNFGAMENKGLNIFNSALLLADAETATDLNFERIESVVAHEYFHNWTGNRITCRDWFQLCLKEGFTVFRDQEFSADMRGATVQRIKDVRALRSRQFPEDQGPLAHPVRPTEYLKIDNFYTATIYEKGAEIIRMLKTMLGSEMFRKGCDYYFDRLDGTASTVEEFIHCFENISGKDLSQFMRWYEQAGTPMIQVNKSGQNIELKQFNRPTPGQLNKKAKVIPLSWATVHDNGKNSEEQLTILDSASIRLSAENGTPSLFRNFSAPVVLKTNFETSDYLRLMAHDKDGFNRWEAGQTIARQLLSGATQAIQQGIEPEINPALRGYTEALKNTLLDNQFDPAFKALVLTPPDDTEIIQALENTDPIAANLAGRWLKRAIGDHLRAELLETYHAMKEQGPFSPSAEAAGRRALGNQALALLASRLDPQAAPLAIDQLNRATNMTHELAALITLTHLGGRRIDQSLENFYEKWKDKPLVIDKWFGVGAARPGPHSLIHVEALTEHPAYDATNPNRVRALIGTFAVRNPEGFHSHDGSGYAFYARQISHLDKRNPSVAARLLGAFEIAPKLDQHRQDLIRAELKSIIASKPSKNVLEIASKILG
ncbi:MAG: aminopeptidase N [Hellea sp.]|nr:aminopeptidase N [Hellea sp.]